MLYLMATKINGITQKRTKKVHTRLLNTSFVLRIVRVTFVSNVKIETKSHNEKLGTSLKMNFAFGNV